MDPSHQGQDWFLVLGEFHQVKKHLPHHKAFLEIVVNKLRKNIWRHQMLFSPVNQRWNFFLVGLDVMEMDSEVVGCQNHVLESAVYMELSHQGKRVILAQVQHILETQNSDSVEEELYYCYLYEMYGYDKYIHLNFEIILNNLDPGRDM